MKALTFTLLFSLLAFASGFAQNDVDKLVQKGIELHDMGEFSRAIQTYEEALKIDPKSALIHYEMALSYFEMKNYEKTIEHSEKAIKINKGPVLQAYLTKGSALDLIGKTKESIKFLKKGIRKFGDDYLLHYNIALNYYKIRDMENAEKHAINAINTNPNHSSSHLILGYVMYEQSKKVQSTLALYYFLLLEPSSSRSKIAHKLLQEVLGSGVSRSEDKPNTVSILLSANSIDDGFGAAEMMLSLLVSKNGNEENKDKTPMELFTDNTTSYFKMLGEIGGGKKGHYWDFYVPFFDKLANSNHIEAYCHYISQSRNPESVAWLDEHETAFNDLVDWVSDN